MTPQPRSARRRDARRRLQAVMAVAVERLAFRTSGRGRPPAEISAVNRYQHDLEAAYDDWADDACRKLANERDPDKRRSLLALLLAALLVTLTDIAHDELPDALATGLGGTPGSPAAYAKLSQEMAANDDYLKNSLIPDIEQRLTNALADPGIKAAIAAGSTAAATDALRGQAALMESRIGQYAGTWWALMNYAVGAQAAKLGKRIRWTRDANARHCADCLRHGDKTYDSFIDLLNQTGGMSPADGVQCRGNCRCILEIVD